MRDAFDVREFVRSANGSLRERLDLDAFRAHPLPEPTVRLLGILGVLEGATMAQLRDVLVTATHKDARVTAFLVSWAYEKFWIADALRCIVDASAPAAPPVSLRERRLTRGPVRRSLAGLVQGESIVGVHLLAGEVDDRVLGAGYQSLIDADPSSILAAAIAEITVVKARHTDFFAGEADARLTSDAKARRLAVNGLTGRSWPIGVERLDAADHRVFANAAFGGAAGSERLDAVLTCVGRLAVLDAPQTEELRARARGEER